MRERDGGAVGAVDAYLHMLTPEQMDRVLTAQDWTANRHVLASGARCLVGHAEGWGALPGREDRLRWDPNGWQSRAQDDALYRARRSHPHAGYVPAVFDRLVRRCRARMGRRLGLAYAVALVKGRAARIALQRWPVEFRRLEMTAADREFLESRPIAHAETCGAP